MKRTICRPLFWNLAIQLARGERLNVVLEALFRGVARCFLTMS